ncbi:protein farnesyltransferase subunit beta-like isoform X2 [Daphnia pulex]|uniref:protein farnesyltransferase subunit beta-like isoform X2 n=1 Tax=Daphnia pulex TaxID=6669 RepID=UPI001EE0E61B|nr:protein farnesyltransferase subunit beta-like isoform X2 [Daphnia pulex]
MTSFSISANSLQTEPLEITHQFIELCTPRIHLDVEGNPTVTSDEQVKVESTIEHILETFLENHEIDTTLPRLNRLQIVDFVRHGLSKLSASYECLDASRTWVCYWNLHSLELLEVPLPDETKNAVISFLNLCQNPTGGFGGGPFQYSHLAPTYAAVNALVILQSEEAFKIINRTNLYNFLMNCRNEEGAFALHVGGEVDVRGTYCAVVVAKLTGIVDQKLFSGTSEWILKCQTYEGGFAGTPNQEAHGGYTFCALAALTLLGQESKCNRWACNRQMKFEGGFQGRTNKLVDGCYSFWQGALFPLLHFLLAKSDQYSEALDAKRWLFNQEALQEYLLVCCQHPFGGLLDKPGRPRDFYHTCYGLSGLSIAQHVSGSGKSSIVGSPTNELALTHPIYNLGVNAVMSALNYFNSQPLRI